MREYLCVLIVGLLSVAALGQSTTHPAAESRPAIAPATPTEIKSKISDYSYWINVPKSYSADNPAGIHLYFAGQNACKNGNTFFIFSKLMDEHNVIGVHMQYPDGDNSKDPAGKVGAALEAISYVRSTFKTIPGRGMMICFSGGGIPASQLFGMGVKSRDWPFCAMSLCGANWRSSIKPGLGQGMSWYVACGTKEWPLAAPSSVGMSQGDRAAELLAQVGGGRSPDIYFHIEKDKDHWMDPADVDGMTDAFARADLAASAIFCDDEFGDAKLKPIVAQANRLELGPAAAALEVVLKDEKAPAELKAKAQKVADRIEARIAAILAMAKKLGAEDPTLCNYYGKMFDRQLTGHPKHKELEDILTAARKGDKFDSTIRAFGAFAAKWSKGRSVFFSSGAEAKINPDAGAYVQGLKDQCVPTSLIGKMAADMSLLTGN